MKKYCINVEGFSVKEREEVLECLYELGYSWDGESYAGDMTKYYVTHEERINWGITLTGMNNHEQHLITPQQLKQEALMSQNPMPKLESGKHVVKLRNGCYYLILTGKEGKLVASKLSCKCFMNVWFYLGSEKGSEWEVVEIHTVSSGNFNDILYFAENKQGILWEKLTPEQIKLKQEITDAQEKVRLAQEALEQAQSVLNGLETR